MAKDKAPAKAAKTAVEPRHDPGWERAVESGVWDRPVDALPNAADWPTRGALRERILMNANEISVTHTTSLRDAFPEELIKLSPSNLQKIEFRGSNKLTRFVVSPIQSCPKLKTVDLSRCASLKFVLLQSESLESLDLSKCSNLEKALVQCKKATSINLDGCEKLKTLMIWSDTVAELVLSQCQKLTKLELYCPALLKENIKMPSVVPSPTKQSPKYVPVARLVLENMNARATVNRSLGGDEAALCGS